MSATLGEFRQFLIRIGAGQRFSDERIAKAFVKASAKKTPLALATSSHRPTVAVDLDGTLLEAPDGQHKPGVFGKPRDGAREFMEQLKKMGLHVIIFTVRTERKAIADVLKKARIPFDEININTAQGIDPSQTNKILADCYVDDRAVNAYYNDWPKVLHRIKQVLDHKTKHHIEMATEEGPFDWMYPAAPAPTDPNWWQHIVIEQAPHTRIVGPTGSGKTTIAQILAPQFPGKIFIIDPVWEPRTWGGLPAATVDDNGGLTDIEAALHGLLKEMAMRGSQLKHGKTDFERLQIIWDEVPYVVQSLPDLAGEFMRRITNYGRHVNMHLLGMGQSAGVLSWGIEGYGDTAENFASIYLGNKAVDHDPSLAGIDHPAVIEWQGILYPFSMSGTIQAGEVEGTHELSQHPERIFPLAHVIPAQEPVHFSTDGKSWKPILLDTKEERKKKDREEFIRAIGTLGGSASVFAIMAYLGWTKTRTQNAMAAAWKTGRIKATPGIPQDRDSLPMQDRQIMPIPLPAPEAVAHLTLQEPPPEVIEAVAKAEAAEALSDDYKKLLEMLKDEPEIPPEDLPVTGDVDAWLISGQWMPVESSNVEAIRYLWDDTALEIEFHGGRNAQAFYRYENVTQPEARDFALSASKGKWVWDNLRLRGTIYGFNQRHPYTFISGPSEYQPRWMRNEFTRFRHGQIGPQGAGGTATERYLFSTDYSENLEIGSALAEQESGPAFQLTMPIFLAGVSYAWKPSDAGNWIDYGRSKQGHQRWKNQTTGEIRYQEQKPGAPAVAAAPVAAPVPAPAESMLEMPDKAKKDFKVGEALIYTGKAGAMPAEFRGWHTDDAGDKMGRVIVRPENAPPFEASVKPDELSRAKNATLPKGGKDGSKSDENVLEGTGGAGDSGRLPAGEQPGKESGESPQERLPRTSEGAGERPERLPDRKGLGGVRSDDETGGRGDSAAPSEGAGTDRDVHHPAGIAVAKSLNEKPTPENPTDAGAGNWHYNTRDFAAGSLKDKFKNNIAAIKTLKAIELEGREYATPAEQEVLSKWVGWGQFPQIFNDYYDLQDLNKQREKEGLAPLDWREMEKEGKAWEGERNQLKELLGDDSKAWRSARRSTLNAHFTHPDIVDAHWEMAKRLGFDGGRFLETSAGAGYYMGMMPSDLANSTHSSAVELDTTTGQIAKLLYPGNTVNIQGFQKYQSPPNFFDLVASNVPFGAYGVNDPNYNHMQAEIHDYFFLKSKDVCRPGGLIMHITSTGTLDKGDDKIRQELAKDCDLVSAIRFPGGAHKENAGTDVVTDMLILRKRLPGEAPGDQAWLQTTTVPDPDGGQDIPINKYFADHPEQILGRLDRSGTMYRAESKNVSLVTPEELTEHLGKPVKVEVDDKGKRHFVFEDGEKVPGEAIARVGGELFRKRLREAIGRVPQGVYTKEKVDSKAFEPEQLPAPGDVKDGGYSIRDGKLWLRQGGALVEQKAGKAKLETIKGQLEIRDVMREIVKLESEGKDSASARAKLNRVYDGFVKKYGFLHAKNNRQAMRGDPDQANLLSLETWDSKAQTAAKTAAIFTRETVRHVPKVEKAANAVDGLAVSLHENGRVNVDHIAKLTGQTKEQIAKELVEHGHAYEDPASGWLPADQYLSGNVRKKLVMARAAAAADPKFKANVEALEKVQPVDLEHSEIDVRLGSPWVPPKDIAEFAAHLVGGNAEDFKIGHLAHNGKWLVKDEGFGSAKKAWETDRVEFEDLLRSALNNRAITVYDPPAMEGEKATVNIKATEAAQAKVVQIKEAFFNEGTGWIWEDDKRRERLVRHYNDNFNNIRRLTYDGQHQTFPGLDPNFTPHPHIKNAVWQTVCTGKAYYGHEVGTGKTTAMVMSAMELRRLGLARKPAIACLKANVEAITREALERYPGAKIISTADMFDKAKRTQVMARIASGDYDMVILTHEHLNSMKMKPEVVAKFLEDEVKDLTNAVIEARRSDPQGKGRIVKDLEKAKLNLEKKLETALKEEAKDDTVYFEDTGIDQLFVDEAHNFQGLPCYTGMGQIKGIPTRRSQKATNMLMRCHWLLERNGDRGVVFASGTPITNTMGEMYNNMRYLQPKELKERGIESFDAWANTFGEISAENEYTVAGEYKPIARFRNFTNVNEMGQIAGQVQDIQRLDNMKMAPEGGITIRGQHFKHKQPIPPHILELATEDERAKLVNTIKRPKRIDHDEVSPFTPQMDHLMKDLIRRAKAIKARRGPPQKGEDIMLTICTDGRKGALDMRLLNPDAPDDPNSKTNRCVNNVLDIWKNHPGKAQLIFSDLGVHAIAKSKFGGGAVESEEKEKPESKEEEDDSAEMQGFSGDEAAAMASTFDLYGDIIDKLVKGGIPRDKIADFSKLEGVAKEQAQDAMRRGDIVVGIGGTQKLGTGVNVQNKLFAMHHLDVPWKPAHLEQRDGRGWRHGNENPEVHVHRYVAEKSLDKMFWNVVSKKAKFIGQYMNTGGKGIRRMTDDDTETMTPDELMAIASGDPKVMEKVDLEVEVKQLGLAEQRHISEDARLKRTVENAAKQLQRTEERMAGRQTDVAALAAHPEFEASVGGKNFVKERKGVDEALKAALAEFVEKRDKINKWDHEAIKHLQREPIGTYRGFTIYPYQTDRFRIAGPSGELWDTGDSLQSIEFVANKTIPKWIEGDKKEIEQAKATAETIKKRIGTGGPFPKAALLKEKKARLAQLEAEMQTAEKSLDRTETYSGGPEAGSEVGGSGSTGAIVAAAQKKPERETPEDTGEQVMSWGKKHQGKTFAQIEQDDPDYLDWVANEADYAPRGLKEDVKAHIAKRPAKAPEPEPEQKPSPPAEAKSPDRHQKAIAISYLIGSGRVNNDVEMKVAEALGTEEFTKIGERLLEATDDQIAKAYSVLSETESAKKAPGLFPEHKEKPKPAITEEQREAVHQALKQLHGANDDRAREKNGVGFSQYDTDFGGTLAELDKLSDKQAIAGAKLLSKYKRQLGDELHEKVTSAIPAPMALATDAQGHEHAPAGSPEGGQFVKKEHIDKALKYVRPEHHEELKQFIGENPTKESVRAQVNEYKWVNTNAGSRRPDYDEGARKYSFVANLTNAIIDDERAVEKTKRKAERGESRKAWVAEQAKYTDAGTWPDGRAFPKEGDEVHKIVGGFGGMQTVIRGVVKKSKKDGLLEVQVTGGGDALGIAHVGKSKGGPLDSSWHMKDEKRTELATATAQWQSFQGPRGGRGWKSLVTGRVVYQQQMPGEHEHKGPHESDQGPQGGMIGEQDLAAAKKAIAKPGHTPPTRKAPSHFTLAKPTFADKTVEKAAQTSHEIAGEWQKKLEPLGIKVVMGGSLVSGLALPSDVHDMDVRFLYDGKDAKDQESMVPKIEEATGLKLRKVIEGVDGGGNGYMIEGKLKANGIEFDVEGQLRNTQYTGWAKYYPTVLSPDELDQARKKKMELRGDKKAYKAYKNSLMDEVKKRVKERGIMDWEKEAAETKERVIPEKSLGVPRHEMPQIQGQHVPEFLAGLEKKGVRIRKGHVAVGKLKPTQGELSQSQMDNLLKKLPPEKLSSSIIISKDGYILDGHHRWGALKQQSPDSRINVTQVDMPIHQLLQEAKGFDKTTYKELGTGRGLPPPDKVPQLREPAGPDDKAWLEEAMQHPYIKEAERRIEEERQKGDTELKYDKRPDGSWDPERVEKVHKPIINHFLNEKAKAGPGERPKAVFLIGPFGAGKSTAGEPIVKKMMPNYTLLNPDEIKAKMPEDQGWNATHLHEESSYLSKQIAKRAKEERHHLLFDASGQNGKKMNEQASELAKMGYDVHVVHVTVPHHISVYRAASRFMENPFGLKDKGKKPTRYAPLRYVNDEVDSKPDQTYKMMKENPDVKSGKSFSTHGVKLGDPVPMVDSFDR